MSNNPDDKKDHIIYRAISPSGKVYIGQTKDLNARKRQHKYDSLTTNSNSFNTPFHNAIRKYGIENFKWEILEKDIPSWIINIKEIEFIKIFNSFSNGYNLTIGGQTGTGFLGKKHTDEAKKKISLARKGKKLSEETKQRMRKPKKPFSEEHKRNLSLAHMGFIPSDETRRKISLAFKGENHPFYGKHLSEETKLKISKSLRRGNSNKRKLDWTKVNQIRERYNSAHVTEHELANEFKISRSNIHSILSFKTWKPLNNE